MTNITFRTQLLGGVTDFCNESALPLATTEILVELVVRLARYQEEGVRLTPQVYLTENIELLISMLPEGEKLLLGSTKADTSGIEEMLKICAPLATGEWKIFGSHCPEGMSYGVFRGSSSPISVDVDEVVISPHETAAVVKAHLVAEECVEILSSKGRQHHIFFNHRKDTSSPPLLYIQNLAQSIVEQVSEREKEAVLSFLTKVLIRTLFKSHGCIVAVTNMRRPPKFLSEDGVILNEPIDFRHIIDELKNKRISQAFLERKAELVHGMLCSDGITLFDERGKLLGYRCFVQVPRMSGVLGGARKRAFATLRNNLGRGISAAFMQSQDGWTEFERRNND